MMERRGDPFRRAFILALGLVCLSCQSGRSPSERLDTLFQSPRAEVAERIAPTLLAHARAARDQAVEAAQRGDDDAEADAATEARLWWMAAIAESDADALRREAAEHQEATAQARLAATRDEALRDELLAAQTHRNASLRARAEAARAFTHAEGYEARRLRRDRDATRALYRETARTLLARARVLIAAARALGEAPDGANGPDALEARAAELSANARPERIVEEANALLRDAMALLGRARARRPGPTPAERASLIAAAAERGLTATVTERGLELTGSTLDRGQAITQLAALILAHPHQGVLLVAMGNRSPRRRLYARARSIRASLVEGGVPEERLRAMELAADIETPLLALIFVSYA